MHTCNACNACSNNNIHRYKVILNNCKENNKIVVYLGRIWRKDGQLVA